MTYQELRNLIAGKVPVDTRVEPPCEVFTLGRVLKEYTWNEGENKWWLHIAFFPLESSSPLESTDFSDWYIDIYNLALEEPEVWMI